MIEHISVTHLPTHFLLLIGHYMFIETSQGAPNSLARMYSRWVYSTGQHCIQFFYSMYGRDIGSLALYVRYGGSRTRDRQFFKQGNQNNTWILGQASVTKKGWFQVCVRLQIFSIGRFKVFKENHRKLCN